MFGQDRAKLRQMYIDSWRKRQSDEILSPLEAMISDIIKIHPEYQKTLEIAGDQDNDYFPEMGQTNPFLHMGMHIAIREQVMTNRPMGIKTIYKQICDKHRDVHNAEHAMMECLGEALFNAQIKGDKPDEIAYLECLRQLK